MRSTHPRSVSCRSAGLFGRAAAVLLSAAAIAALAAARPAPVEGLRHVDPRWHALVNATLVPEPGRVIENATIVVRDGLIVSVESGGRAPEGARVWDYRGRTVYPGLIDAHVPVNAPTPAADVPGAYWNARVTPQRSALDGDGMDSNTREALRKLGFTTAAIAPRGGVFRGSAAVVSLADPGDELSADAAPVIAPKVYQEVAFETARGRSSEYPSSQMGAIALIRQTLLDASWHASIRASYEENASRHEPPGRRDALEALDPADSQRTPLLFVTGDELEALRAAKLARELNRPAMLLGSGTEFRRLAAIAEDGLPVILPINYPSTPKVETLADQEAVTLREMMTWEQAPTNPRRLHDAGVTVALTTDTLRRRPEFAANLRKAIEHGLSEDVALAMLTTNPAKMLGLEDRIGRVAPGMLANMVVVKGGLFDKDATIHDVWVGGKRHEITEAPTLQLAGAWEARFDRTGPAEERGEFTASLTVTDRNAITLERDSKRTRARSVSVNDNRVSFLLDGAAFGAAGVYALGAIVEHDVMHGYGATPEGVRFHWSAQRDASSTSAAGPDDDKDKDEEKADEPQFVGAPEELPTPLGAYGLHEIPPQEDVVLTGATVWTAARAGIIENGAVVISRGRIVYVGPAASAPRPDGARVVDLEGRHITPGLIDCHSHTGISGGVNEGTHAITAEVRIADVINPDAVDWYRQLAGGLTMANQLHGSANPIGGQNSVVKLRWGAARPDDMLMKQAPPGIKFALGENVKQSNWGERFTTRYPQTRMGVETIIRDAFIGAQEYARDWTGFLSQGTGVTPEQHAMPADVAALLARVVEKYGAGDRVPAAPPRRDLRAESVAAILVGDRLVHCHSYRQDEILMLCRVAEEFDFKIGSFQHVLEGYKVAEAIMNAAIGASAFSDWWAFKFEVYDAIPFNGAIMHDVGVNVSFNSDSNELARRMNTEAGKAVKYGGVEPNEALKFVTYNPAKQLGIADRVGSLEVGKDADLAIWSGDPLSYYSRCLATYVDGRKLFCVERDMELREEVERERRRLIQKILAQAAPSRPERPREGVERAGRGGVTAQADPESRMTLMERIEAEALERHYLELLRAGIDPEAARCGECGVLHFDFSTSR